MSKKKVLFVTQELNPYTEISFLSDLARKIPNYASGEGFELRVLMPKFGITTLSQRILTVKHTIQLNKWSIPTLC